MTVRLFVADPSPSARENLRRFFVSLGYEVHLASEVHELADAEGGDPDFDVIVVADPTVVADPRGFAERIWLERLQDRVVPVILVDPDPPREGEPAGMLSLGDDLYLSRGASLLELLFQVRELVDAVGEKGRQMVRVWGGFPLRFLHQGVWHKALVYNVSRGGAFVQSELLPDVADRVRFRIPVGDTGVTLEGRGFVRWHNPGEADGTLPTGFGLAFDELAEGTGDVLYRMVDDRDSGNRAAGS